MKPVRGSAWSLTKEYRKETSRRRRMNVGVDAVNTENRKYYHTKVARLLAMQEGKITDEAGELRSYVINRMLRAAKWRAKRDGLPFDLVATDIVLPATCPVSGAELRLSVMGSDSRAAYSLDRVDNSKGYTKDNVRVISKEVNAIKGSKPVEFFEKLVAYMKGKL